MNPILQMRRLSPRAVKSLSQGHQDPNWKNDHSQHLHGHTRWLEGEKRVYLDINWGSRALIRDLKTLEPGEAEGASALQSPKAPGRS